MLILFRVLGIAILGARVRELIVVFAELRI